MNGWSPASVTWDADGNVLTVTTTEPRFTPAEKMLLLASRRQVRGPHGIRMSEALDPANQFAFEVEPPVMDWAQKALNDAEEKYRKANPKVDMSAVHMRVRKR